jgi:hypothetical protein
MNKLVLRAIKKAQQSICRLRVAALGFNAAGVCVMTRTNRPRFLHKGGGYHAERRVLAQAKQKGIVRILICRISKSGNLLPIDPCSTCQNIADKLGVELATLNPLDSHKPYQDNRDI